MREVEVLNVNIIEDTPLAQSIVWAERFLNDLGADFSLATVTHNTAVLMNYCSCPGFKGTGVVCTDICNDIERAVCKAVKTFDPSLTAGFTKCSCDEGSVCELTLRVS